jgi:hypothetical protein
VETYESDDDIQTEVSSEDQAQDEAEDKEMKETFLAVSGSDDESDGSEDYIAESGVEEEAALDTEEEEDSESDSDDDDEEMMDLD